MFNFPLNKQVIDSRYREYREATKHWTPEERADLELLAMIKVLSLGSSLLLKHGIRTPAKHSKTKEELLQQVEIIRQRALSRIEKGGI